MSGHQQHAQLLIDAIRMPTAGSTWPEPSPPDLTVDHLGLRRGHDPQAARGGTPTELDPVAEAGNASVEAAEGLPVVQPEQHPAGAHAQLLPRLVALPLVDLAEVEARARAVRCRRR